MAVFPALMLGACVAAVGAAMTGHGAAGGIGMAAPRVEMVALAPAGHAAQAQAMPAASPGAPVVLHRAADGLFYVSAAIDGQQVRFAVDTGASVVVLSAADAARAGILGREPIDGVATASGTTSLMAGTARRLQIGDRLFADVPVTIAAQGAVSLIGESLLSRFREISIKGDRMELR